MSKEAEEFWRNKMKETYSNYAGSENLSKFFDIVNYREQGRWVQEYADKQLAFSKSKTTICPKCSSDDNWGIGNFQQECICGNIWSK